MSHRLYASSAERQRAYRDRQRAGRSPVPPPRDTAPVPRPPSRPARIRALVDEVRKLAEEYQNWRDRLPGNLAEGQTAARIEEVKEQLDEIADALEAIDPPSPGR